MTFQSLISGIPDELPLIITLLSSPSRHNRIIGNRLAEGNLVKFYLSRSVKNKGQAAAVLNLFLAVFFIAVLGIFSVELSRYMLARDQLKDCVAAAALCCQTTLASTGAPNNSSNQNAAQQAALNLFQQNSILGQILSSSILVSTPSGQSTPDFELEPGEAQICFQFLDPITRLPVNSSSGLQNTSSTSSSGTFIQAIGAYSYVPVFGKFIGLGNAQFACEATANSGIPQLDLVFVYDVSGAQNEQTPTTDVQRLWNTPYGIDYLLPSPVGSPPTTSITGGPLAPFCVPSTPTPNYDVNPTTPQNLNNGQSCSSPLLEYTEQSGAATQQLTGAQAYAAPPGNYPYNGQIYVLPISISGWSGNAYAPAANINAPGVIPIALSDYIAYPIVSMTGQPYYKLLPPAGSSPYTADYIIYVAKNSGLGSAWLSHRQTSYILSNSGSSGNAQLTVALGGGSAFASAGPYPVPTGPTAPIGANSNSAVASVLAGSTYDSYGHTFTDIVTNIDNNLTFKNATVSANGNTYKFPSLGALVEASRGNLESLNTAQAAGLNLTALGLSQSDLQSGYYAAYVQAALASIQPMNTVANSTVAFMNQLAQVSDIHFGCLTFNDYTGTNASSTAPPGGITAPNNIASNYTDSSINTNPDGTIGYTTTNTYSMPDILLNPTGNTTQSAIANVLPTIHTWGNCNVANALNAALGELNPQIVGSSTPSPARPSANKAIILITSQAPNVGLNGDTGVSALKDALAQAQLANQAGIPIYCVSIAQSSSDDTNEDAAYNDNNGGIAATAGNGSKYYRIDWSNSTASQSALTSAFANIARRLVCVIH